MDARRRGPRKLRDTSERLPRGTSRGRLPPELVRVLGSDDKTIGQRCGSPAAQLSIEPHRPEKDLGRPEEGGAEAIAFAFDGDRAAEQPETSLGLDGRRDEAPGRPARKGRLGVEVAPNGRSGRNEVPCGNVAVRLEEAADQVVLVTETRGPLVSRGEQEPGVLDRSCGKDDS